MLGPLLTRLLTFSVGCLWPGYRSYQAIKAASDKDDDATKQEVFDCLVYWIILATFSFLEQVGDVVMSWLPFYYEAKALFILWIALPHFNGSRTLYDCLVQPWLQKNENHIDRAIEDAGAFAKSQAILAGKKTLSFVQNRGVEIMYAGKKYLEDNSQSKLKIEDVTDGDQSTADGTSDANQATT